jgi:dTDP-glucose pyrophosphorylase
MDLERFTVSENATIIETMEKININAMQVAFVCDQGMMRAVVTDGDIRRHILRGGSLNEKIKKIANYHPHYIIDTALVDTKDFMLAHSINAVPIINKDGRLLSIEFLNKKIVYENTSLHIPVVIQAGGKGTRLKPYTQILPKPLIPIGDKTIIELIMERFERFSCDKFDIIVNYKKNFIKAYFTDSDTQRNIRFIDETVFMGTGGGLRLLAGKYTSTFFMSNCDIIIEEDYSKILAYHNERHNIITMLCAMKNFTIPYGTVEIDNDGRVLSLKEKPNFSFMTNTGFYVIEPRFLDKIPENTFIHITDLIQNCINDGENVGMYPISENAWMDMGQMEELEKMRERLGS